MTAGASASCLRQLPVRAYFCGGGCVNRLIIRQAVGTAASTKRNLAALCGRSALKIYAKGSRERD
jgi:hypothetical protein